MDEKKGGRTNEREMAWSYSDIMGNGSEELKSIITFITGGNPPGIPIKEENHGTED